MKKVKTNVKKVSFLSYVSVALLVIIVTFAMWQSSMAYFKITRQAEGAIQLGDIDFQILIDPNELQTEDDGIIMPAETVFNKISIINSRTANGGDIEGLSSFYLKITPDLYINSIKMDNSLLAVQLLDANAWITSEDAYYYKGVILPGEIADFSKSFSISKSISNSYSELPLDLGITADVIQAGGGMEGNFWPDAPPEWINYLENL